MYGYNLPEGLSRDDLDHIEGYPDLEAARERFMEDNEHAILCEFASDRADSFMDWLMDRKEAATGEAHLIAFADSRWDEYHKFVEDAFERDCDQRGDEY